MHTIERSALLPYSQEKLYCLVNDIEKYPEFLPDCRGSEILSIDEHQVVARVDIGGLVGERSFTTRNQLRPNSSIKMALEAGPFKTLEGEWRFIALAEDATKLELELAFEFDNLLAALAFKKVFNHMATSMVKAFTERARKIYGENP